MTFIALKWPSAGAVLSAQKMARSPACSGGKDQRGNGKADERCLSFRALNWLGWGQLLYTFLSITVKLKSANSLSHSQPAFVENFKTTVHLSGRSEMMRNNKKMKGRESRVSLLNAPARVNGRFQTFLTSYSELLSKRKFQVKWVQWKNFGLILKISRSFVFCINCSILEDYN